MRELRWLWGKKGSKTSGIRATKSRGESERRGAEERLGFYERERERGVRSWLRGEGYVHIKTISIGCLQMTDLESRNQDRSFINT